MYSLSPGEMQKVDTKWTLLCGTNVKVRAFFEFASIQYTVFKVLIAHVRKSRENGRRHARTRDTRFTCRQSEWGQNCILYMPILTCENEYTELLYQHKRSEQQKLSDLRRRVQLKLSR